MIILYLTCANDIEAAKITDALLQARLVTCVRRMNVSSTYWWNDTINKDEEVLLMMEGVQEKFDGIEAVVAGLHSYEEFVLTAVDVLRTTPGTEKWLNDALEQ